MYRKKTKGTRAIADHVGTEKNCEHLVLTTTSHREASAVQIRLGGLRSTDLTASLDSLAVFCEDIGKEVSNQLGVNSHLQIHFSSIGDLFLVEILNGATEVILKTIYISIGPKLDISGVMDNVTCHEIEGVSIDFYPGARETTVYLPDANYVIRLLKLLEKTTKSSLRIMEHMMPKKVAADVWQSPPTSTHH